MSYLRELGFEVTTVIPDDMTAFKAEYLIPPAMSSCHTAVFEDSGYVVEGHMPIVAIDQLLANSPDIDGIALPGMPPGTPGMGGRMAGPLEVFALKDGLVSLYALLDPAAATE